MKHVIDIRDIDAVIEEASKWTIMDSDGLPFLYGSQLADSMYVCVSVKAEFDKSAFTDEEWVTVETEKCNINRKQNLKPLYDEILLIPGPGHIELNAAHCLLKMLWELML